ncbi:hypothetical protein N431DRAFT_488163 [Stipitochalara longipes BDJ]|nr:hypothetical protein N431DRAFT_488163 [Stipitochalara longipes BDJ]
MLDATFTSLRSEKLPKAGPTYRMMDMEDSLCGFTFIPKMYLLKAFAQNIPVLSILAQDPSLSDVHWECRQQMLSLQREEANWDRWTSEMTELLHIPENSDMTTARSKITTITLYIEALKGLAVNCKEELSAGSAEKETLRGEISHREGNYRKKKDELRKELKDKDTRIQVLEMSSQELHRLKNDRIVADREEKAKIKDEALRKAQRKGLKDIVKESKANDAQLAKQLREEQKKVSNLEHQLEDSTNSKNVLQLDLDAYVVENLELKKSHGMAQKTEDQQKEITALREDVKKYRQITTDSQLIKKVVNYRPQEGQTSARATPLAQKERFEETLSKELVEKDKKLRQAQGEIQALHQQLNDQNMRQEDKRLAELAARDKLIRDLCRAGLDLQKEVASKNVEIARLDTNREAIFKLAQR